MRRNAGGVDEIWRDDPFEFDAQTFNPVEVLVHPGDDLETHCVYDSSDRIGPTRFGENTDDEMCIAFLLYYPAGAMQGNCI